ncbi:hypothetical protein ACKWTF_002023 [Chironomus riparius]
MDVPLKLTNASRKQIPFVKTMLRKKVPYLSIQEIRRFKLPLVDAMSIDLDEAKHYKALSIFREILKIDKNHNKCFTDDKNLNLLEEIFKSLVNLENKNGEEELMIIIELVKKFSNEDESFDWLIELLLIKGNQFGANRQLEETKSYTILSYIHGLFLSHRLHWHQAALLHFELAYKNILANDDWTFEDKMFCFKITQELSDCLIKLSRQIRIGQNDPKTAFIYASRSLTVLRNIISDDNVKLEIDVETEYGDCLFDQGLFDEAEKHFEHALVLSEKYECTKNFCESLIKMIKCFEGLEDFEMSENLLYIAQKYASDKSLLDLKGNILIMLMEFYVKQRNVYKINCILAEAYDCFVTRKDDLKLLGIETLYAHAGGKF